ncbi:hypothetical protein O181_116644 [Austropuccinia psidii MF-1]|uniref:Uncharacterized protein n=1 Tax=Austropuccinia psidii MF-1 TaxID=1389203 RepID=A0A9Q3K983_9BASI|nr:hypothetical protein [Austropuccinia psidii MF-1]
MDQESPFFKIPGTFKEKTGIKREKQDFIQQGAERVRPQNSEEVGLYERSTQEPEIAVDTSNRIISPAHRNIIPTQNGHSVVTPESNINSNELLLPIYQFAEQAQGKFANIQENDLRS